MLQILLGFSDEVYEATGQNVEEIVLDNKAFSHLAMTLAHPANFVTGVKNPYRYVVLQTNSGEILIRSGGNK